MMASKLRELRSYKTAAIFGTFLLMVLFTTLPSGNITVIVPVSQRNLPLPKSGQLVSAIVFSKQYEQNRRRERQAILDRWSKIKHKFQISNVTRNSKKYLDEKRIFVQAMAMVEQFRETDGLDKNRIETTRSLSKIIQDRLWRMQNPKNCSEAKFFYCDKRYTCGFGCLIHHVLVCFAVAFASNRTLLLDESFYKMSKHFQPVSKSCPWSKMMKQYPKKNNVSHFSEINAVNEKFVYMLPYETPRTWGQYIEALPYNLPQELAEELILVSPDPYAWFIGQFAKFLLRPLKPFDSNQHFPRAAIHIRRTDKLKHEAEYHDSIEYMNLVEEFYDIQDAKAGKTGSVVREVFVATDEPEVIKEIQAKYPGYKIIANLTIASTVNNLHDRNSHLGIDGIVRDLQILAKAEFLVCTMSSNVCRLTYEMRNLPFESDLDLVRSLDVKWYVWPFKRTKRYRAIEKSSNNLTFDVGDEIIVHNAKGRPLEGFNERTNKSGPIELSKLQELFAVSDKFPSFYN